MSQKQLKPQNFRMRSGNNKTLNFTHRDKDGVLVDITGATIEWALAESEKSKTPLVVYVGAPNVTITDAASGKYSVAIQSADTESLPARDYYHEIRMTSAAGEVNTPVIGTVELKRNLIDT